MIVSQNDYECKADDSDGESKNRPVATNFQFLKILAPLGQLLVGACLPQTLLERVRQTGIYIIIPLTFPILQAFPPVH